jgi:positive regulator of sigma E activity
MSATRYGILLNVSSERWSSRQGDALFGMVPVVILMLSSALGAGVAALLGLAEWIGAVAGIALSVAGFFVSRAVLRQRFARKAR